MFANTDEAKKAFLEMSPAKRKEPWLAVYTTVLQLITDNLFTDFRRSRPFLDFCAESTSAAAAAGTSAVAAAPATGPGAAAAAASSTPKAAELASNIAIV